MLWDLLFALGICWPRTPSLAGTKWRRVAKFIALLSLILFIPLPALIMTGMEPPMQILVSMLTVFLPGRWLSGESPGSARGDSIRLLILAPMVTGVRFEGMFLIIAIGLILLTLRRWLYALAFCVLGFLPVIVYGIISVSKGWFWLPNSVLLKATLPSAGSPGGLILSLCYAVMANTRMALHVPGATRRRAPGLHRRQREGKRPPRKPAIDGNDSAAGGDRPHGVRAADPARPV